MKQSRERKRSFHALGLFLAVGPLKCHGMNKIESTVVDKLVCQLQLHAIDYSLSNVFDTSSEDDQPEYLVTCSPVDTESGVVSGELLKFGSLANGSDALSMFRERFLEQKQPYLSVSPARFHSNIISVDSPTQLEIVERPKNVADTSTSASPAIGTKRTLLLRVSTRDSEPDVNASELYYHTFQSQSSLAIQMSLCSFGQLTLEPHMGGIWEVKLGNFNATDEDYMLLVNAATSLVSRSQNVSSVTELADLIFIVLPPGTRGKWVSFSTLSGSLSVFNNQWASKVSTLAHGIGHNFGLGHARRAGAAQGEQTGFMGLAYASPDISSKCFNAANYWELGWVAEGTMALDASEEASPSMVPLTSIVDVVPEAGESVAILKFDDLYMLYNRAKGFNTGTGDLRNSVVIVQPIAWGTQLVAGLDLVQPLFTRTSEDGSTLTIELCRTPENEDDDQGAPAGNTTARLNQVLVSVGYNTSTSLCPPPVPSSTGPWTNASQGHPHEPSSQNATSDDSASETGAQSRTIPNPIRIWISVLVACLGLLALLACWGFRRGRRARRSSLSSMARLRTYRKMDSTTLRSAGDCDDDDLSSCGDGLGSVGGASFASDSTRVFSNVTGTAEMSAAAPTNAAAIKQAPDPGAVRRSYYYTGGPQSRPPASVLVPPAAPTTTAISPPDPCSAPRLFSNQDDVLPHPESGSTAEEISSGDAQSSCVRSDWFFEEGLWGASEI
jgi:Gametolysin peptidase M11